MQYIYEEMREFRIKQFMILILGKDLNQTFYCSYKKGIDGYFLEQIRESEKYIGDKENEYLNLRKLY